MQDSTQEGIVDADLAVVCDEGQFLEFVMNTLTRDPVVPMISASISCETLGTTFPRDGAAGSRALMAFPLTAWISDELLATPGKPCWHVPLLVWNARVRSGDLLSRDVRRQHGARVRRVRGIRQLFGASPWHSVVHPRCPIMDTRAARPPSFESFGRILQLCEMRLHGFYLDAMMGS